MLSGVRLLFAPELNNGGLSGFHIAQKLGRERNPSPEAMNADCALPLGPIAVAGNDDEAVPHFKLGAARFGIDNSIVPTGHIPSLTHDRRGTGCDTFALGVNALAVGGVIE